MTHSNNLKDFVMKENNHSVHPSSLPALATHGSQGLFHSNTENLKEKDETWATSLRIPRLADAQMKLFASCPDDLLYSCNVERHPNAQSAIQWRARFHSKKVKRCHRQASRQTQTLAEFTPVFTLLYLFIWKFSRLENVCIPQILLFPNHSYASLCVLEL